MEQTRILVAVVLSFLVLLIYQMFFVDKKTETTGSVQDETAVVQEQLSRVQESDDDVLTGNDPIAVKMETGRNAETFVIETPLYQVSISEAGAAFKSFRLKKYLETVEKDSDPKELIDPENTMGTLIVGFNGLDLKNASEGVYTCQSENKKITVQNNPESISFIIITESNISIKKTFTFYPETYLIDVDVTVENRSGNMLRDQLSISMMDNSVGKTTRLGFSGPSTMVNNQLEEMKIKKLSEPKSYNGNVSWAAFQDRYFMSSIIPEQEENVTVRFKKRGENYIETSVSLPETSIDPNSQKQFSFQAYFGPKNITLLKELGHRLEKVVDFGWFDWFARPCLWIMNLIYRFIPNYGVAIILLTLIIKGILWPLGNKSYKSMGQMKKMQPLMAEIREKYKDDKQKMNMELMALYKTYKVNPLGGCLPMFVQLPVLYGLYRMLYQAVELRHAPFVGWIQDLSAPERLFNFSFSIPYMQAPYGIPVLTILMGLSMVLQQKMQPTTDPSQAKMMMFMPIFFIFICINISSGLVLYWLVSQIISILQQYYVTKKTI